MVNVVYQRLLVQLLYFEQQFYGLVIEPKVWAAVVGSLNQA